MFYTLWTEKGKKEGYSLGYRDGSVNVKAYFSEHGKLPTKKWLIKQEGTLIDTLEKLRNTK